MDPRCSPGWVSRQPSGENQFLNLLRRLFPSQPASGLWKVHTKTCTPVPADDSFRCDDEESLFPSGPDPLSDYPEKAYREARDSGEDV